MPEFSSVLMWCVGAEAGLDLKRSTIVVTLVERDCHVKQGNHRQGDAETVPLHRPLQIGLLESNEAIRNKYGVIVLLSTLFNETHGSW